jgi:hypothetical protein
LAPHDNEPSCSFFRAGQFKQDYDFRLAKTSVAIDRADPATATKTDRNAMPRDERPDVGAYEFKEEKTEEPNPQE